MFNTQNPNQMSLGNWFNTRYGTNVYGKLGAGDQNYLDQNADSDMHDLQHRNMGYRQFPFQMGGMQQPLTYGGSVATPQQSSYAANQSPAGTPGANSFIGNGGYGAGAYSGGYGRRY